MPYDIIAWAIEDNCVAIGHTPEGVDYLRGFDPTCLVDIPSGQGSDVFLDFLESIPKQLRIGILDPMGKIHNFTSQVLH